MRAGYPGCVIEEVGDIVGGQGEREGESDGVSCE